MEKNNKQQRHPIPRVGDSGSKKAAAPAKVDNSNKEVFLDEDAEKDYPLTQTFDPHRQITCKAGQLMDPETQEAIKRLFQKNLSAGVAMRLLKLKKKAEEEINTLNELRTQKVMEYGAPGDDGMTRVTPENLPVFAKFINELYSQDIIFDIPPIEFRLISSVEFSVSELDRISWFIKEEE